MSRNVCKLWQESRFGNWQTENGWARAALTVQTQNLRITRLQLDTKTILHVFSFIYLYIYSFIIIIVVLIHVNTFQPKSVIAQKVFEISHASLGFLFLFIYLFLFYFFFSTRGGEDEQADSEWIKPRRTFLTHPSLLAFLSAETV